MKDTRTPNVDGLIQQPTLANCKGHQHGCIPLSFGLGRNAQGNVKLCREAMETARHNVL